MKRIALIVIIFLQSIWSLVSAQQVELIDDGNFDSLYTFWNTNSAYWWISDQFQCSNTPFAYAYFGTSTGGYINDGYGGVYQDVYIPANANSVEFTFSYSINTYEITSTSVYDILEVQLRDPISNGLLLTITQLSNLNGDSPGCQVYTPTPTFNIPSNFYGGIVRIYFQAANNGLRETKFRIDDVSLIADIPASINCVTWNNGIPGNVNYFNAAELLCQVGIIEDVQDNFAVSYITRSEIATILFNGLYGIGGTSPAEFFPTPFIDLNTISNQHDQTAYKTLLYCQYNDNETAFSRDIFMLYPSRPLLRGNCLKAIFEAWNIPAFNLGSPFSDVNSINPNYKYIVTAFNNGYLNNTSIQSCGPPPCFNSNGNISREDFYIILSNIIQQGFVAPTPSLNEYFKPNTFFVSNISNKADLDRAVFNDYEDPSFFIPGGGIPLEFSHSYHSNWVELPVASSECLPLNWYKQVNNPLGIGWTHTYNIHISKIFNLIDNTCIKLIIWWPDGTVQSYDVLTHQYETVGVTDNLQIINVDANGVPTRVTVTKKNGLTYEFNLIYLGQFYDLSLTVIRDRNLQSNSITYDLGVPIDGYTVSRVKEVIDNFSNRRIYFYYQPGTNYLSSVVDNSGRTIIFSVNSMLESLETFTDAKGQVTHYGYDIADKHLLKGIQRPNGNWITNTYFQKKLVSTNSNSYNISIDFNTNYLSSSTTTNSNITVSQNGNTYSSTIEHDERGNAISIVVPDGNVSIQYTDNNNPDKPTQIIDNSTGIRTDIVYEPNKRANPIAVTTSNAGESIVESFTYDVFNQIIQYTNPENQLTSYIYDVKGNLTFINEPNGIQTHNDYLPNGLLNYSINPTNLITNFHYNANGNLDSCYISGTNIFASASYDNVSRITSIKNADGKLTQYGYDPNDNLTDERFDPAGLNYLTHRMYDSNDNLVSIVAPKGDVTNLNYDFITDQLLSESYGSFSKSWSYNTDGSIQSYIDKNGFNFQYQYYPQADPNAGKIQTDGYATFQYDNTSHYLLKSSRNSNQLSYSYDALGRISSVLYNDIINYSNIVSYSYNHNSNNLRYIEYPLPSTYAPFKIEYVYDSNNRLAQVKNANTGIAYVQYFYRNDSQLDHEVYGNGTATFYYYDVAGRLDSIRTIKSNNDEIATVGSDINEIGNHTRESHIVNFNGPGNPPNGPLNDTTINYQLDVMNRLINFGTFTLGYNNNGDATNNSNIHSTYTWNERDNLLTSTMNGVTSTYQYDPNEHRRLKDSTRYIIDDINNSNILVETNLLGDPVSLFVHGIGLVCRINPQTNAVYYYHYDFRGSTIAITDSNQVVNQKYAYDAFGALTNADGWGSMFSNPFRYVGKYGVMYDDNSHYFMRARYYSPQLGRFISEDPKWDIDLYPYAGNNPISNIDPDGEFFETAFDIVSLGYSTFQFSKHPTLANLGFLAWDIASVALPFVPGS
jgi:RHS repeat-associated protein